MLSFLTASVLRDLSFKTRLGRRPHTINTDSLASLHSTQLAGLTLTLFSPRSTKCNRDPVSPLIVGGGRILVEFPIRACALAAANVAMPRETTCAHQPLPARRPRLHNSRARKQASIGQWMRTCIQVVGSCGSVVAELSATRLTQHLAFRQSLTLTP